MKILPLLKLQLYVQTEMCMMSSLYSSKCIVICRHCVILLAFFALGINALSFFRIIFTKSSLNLVSVAGPEGSKKSGVVVEFSTLCYHLRSPGDMSPDELDEVVDFLMERIETQEKTELFHLENFHRTLERYYNCNSGSVLFLKTFFDVNSKGCLHNCS